MQRLRTISGFVHVLVALFLVAQFAGAIPSPLPTAEAFANAAALHAHQEHMHSQGLARAAHHHGHQTTDHVDHCCALHAFFAGVLPPAVVVESVARTGQRLTPNLTERGVGLAPGRLDRPPKPIALI
jgi:hypothetical protein